MAEGIPTDRVIELRKQNLRDNQIIQMLEQEGFMPSQILEAINQAKMRNQVTGKTIEGIVAEDQTQQQPPTEQPATQEQQPVAEEQAFAPQEEMPPMEHSTYDDFNMPPGTIEVLQEISEKIVEEKWQQLYQEVMQIFNWKNKVEAKIIEMDNKINAIHNGLTSLQSSIFGKMHDYDENIQEFGTEIKAMNKVFKQFVPDMKNTISEMNKVADKFKDHSKK